MKSLCKLRKPGCQGVEGSAGRLWDPCREVVHRAGEAGEGMAGVIPSNKAGSVGQGTILLGIDVPAPGIVASAVLWSDCGSTPRPQQRSRGHSTP